MSCTKHSGCPDLRSNRASLCCAAVHLHSQSPPLAFPIGKINKEAQQETRQPHPLRLRIVHHSFLNSGPSGQSCESKRVTFLPWTMDSHSEHLYRSTNYQTDVF